MLPGDPSVDGMQRGQACGFFRRALRIDGNEACEQREASVDGGLDGHGDILPCEHVEQVKAFQTKCQRGSGVFCGCELRISSSRPIALRVSTAI